MERPGRDRSHAINNRWRTPTIPSRFGPASRERSETCPVWMFDLYNEPYISASDVQGDVWQCWLNGCSVTGGNGVSGSWTSAGMQQLVDAVRGAGAPNVIIAGGLDYSSEFSGWLTHMPQDPMHNLGASSMAHVQLQHVHHRVMLGRGTSVLVAAQVPVITGGLRRERLQGSSYAIDSFFTYADTLGLSYIGWTWNAWGGLLGRPLTHYGLRACRHTPRRRVWHWRSGATS